VVRADGVKVPRSEAEATRRRLIELGVLRSDLEVGRDGESIVFPVIHACGPRLPVAPFEFAPRATRLRSYLDLLPEPLRAAAPRSFDAIGDIVLVKLHPDQRGHAAAVGQALLEFNGCRAVFWDAGVKDPYRTRELTRIAGTGGSLTSLAENGCTFWVDPARAYFSPRLAHERERVAALVQPGELVVDLFGGVAPFGVQLAKKGAVVRSIDLNPAATELAERNVEQNGVAAQVTLHTGDARAVAAGLPKADRLILNLPHGAKLFLDVAARSAKPGATIHYHEILPPQEVASRGKAVLAELAHNGWRGRVAATRVVRNYSPQEAHVAFDLVGVVG
jgi:tRNA (guanine37-N1)-methyltransferase